MLFKKSMKTGSYSELKIDYTGRMMKVTQMPVEDLLIKRPRYSSATGSGNNHVRNNHTKRNITEVKI